MTCAVDVLVTWAPVFGATGYTVYRSSTASGPFERVTSGTGVDWSFRQTNQPSATGDDRAIVSFFVKIGASFAATGEVLTGPVGVSFNQPCRK